MVDPLMRLSSPPPEQDLRDPEEIIATQKQKLLILKQAYVKLKTSNDEAVKQIKEYENQISLLNVQLSQKDSQITDLIYDKDDLAVELDHVKTLVNDPNSAPESPIKQIGNRSNKDKALEQQNKQLLEEYHYLKKQVNEQESTIRDLEKERDQLKRDYATKGLAEMAELKQLHQDHEFLLKQYTDKEDEYATLAKANVNLSDTKSRLNEEWERLNDKADALAEQLKEAKQEIEDKVEAMKLMQNSIMTHGENEAHLAARLMEMKEQLFQAKSYYQKYPVTKIGRINTAADFILRRGTDGEFVIDIATKKRVISWNISMITAINQHPTRLNRFEIVVSGEPGNNEFESNDTTEIVGQIREFIMKNIS